MSLNFWVILVGILASVGCSLVGCFLVLRRMSLLGDAISHAVLPGIAIGFLVGGSVSGPGIFIGALVTGLLTAYLTQTLSQAVKVTEDASLGVVFTSLFALGVILLSQQVDLDQDCVLYGEIQYTPIQLTTILGFSIPIPVLQLSSMLLIIIIVITSLWKEWKLASFDPELATALGFRANLLHYLLMALTAGITVAAFRSVGSILVVAMLIVPAATAQLLTHRLSSMLLIASVLGSLASVSGYALAVRWDVSVSGMMAVATGAVFVLAFLFAPEQGIVAKLVKQLRLSLRISREDILGELYRQQERGSASVALSSLAADWKSRFSFRQLLQHQLISNKHDQVQLTSEGMVQAQQLVRAHRLWEAYLDKNVKLPADHLHAPAHKMEHYIGPHLVETIAHDLDEPAADPHGKAIPGKEPGARSQ
jgi:manganese/zinc/iron transport system permease protein